MKSKDILLRFAIMMGLLIAGALVGFMEVGIATVFDIKYNGLTYMQYVADFYQVPWHCAIGIFIVVIFLVFGAEIIYRGIKKGKD